MHSCIFAYQMGRLCGGAHEISGIPAPLCLCGWVVGGHIGWVGCGGVGDVLVGVVVVLWGVGGYMMWWEWVGWWYVEVDGCGVVVGCVGVVGWWLWGCG